ncbi:MAG: aldo/keto reductase [Chloroflexi bacterium]|nr:aldo/keto reductase [Chloroflexota bacterium]
MRYRTLGRTGLSVSALALGTVELGLEYGIPLPGESGRPGDAEGVRIVHASLDGGVNFIDTARAYGESERVLGLALADRRDRVVLASKVATQRSDGCTPTGDELRRTMCASLDVSLRQLHTDWLDIWQIHNVDTALLEQAETVAEVFATARRAGKVRWTGGSFYGAALPLAALNYDIFDVMQVTYSVLDQRLADHFFAAAQARKVGVVVRSVLLKGALTERGEHLPDHLEPLRERSRRFRRTVAEAGIGCSPAQAAVAFALAQPAIHAVLVGVGSVQEVNHALQAATLELPPALVDQLRGLRLDDEGLLNPGTWGIG